MAQLAFILTGLLAQTGAATTAHHALAQSLAQPLAMAEAPADAAKQPVPSAPAPATPTSDAADAPDLQTGVLDGRRRPGFNPDLPAAPHQMNLGAVKAPPPSAFPTDTLPLPDRWRIMTSLCPAKGGEGVYDLFHALAEVCHKHNDPYHQNPLKGDRPIDRAKVPWLPIHEDDWFFEGNLISDTLFEPRSFPLPITTPTSQRPGSIDAFGKDASYVMAQTVLVGASLIKCSTNFKPPEIEYHVTLAFNVNYARVPERQILSVDAAAPPHRVDGMVALQEAFVDYHIHNVSDRYDFDAVRVGIQPFQADFRGFLFNDQQLGVRLFGNRDDNRFQYNLAAFWRIQKDSNSGLNDVTKPLRKDLVFIANLYRQDFLVPGFTSQLTVVYNRNREGNDVVFDTNGFPVRPALIGNLKGRDYDVVYLGYNADGHIHKLNLTASTYLALGRDHNSNFTGQPADIRSWFAAAEASYDHDWMRFRVSGLYASGDSNPRDNTETGFDAISENPIFAGADTSYWIRQGIPFIGGGRGISLSGRNGVLNDLRSSKDEGQSNFTNPGTVLAGVGADFDLTPTLRVATNANHLWFDKTEVLKLLRLQGNVAHDIGWDLSGAITWRPKATNNVVLRLSAAMLDSGQGMRDLFGNSSGDANYYSVLANAILSF